jgi:hypothetical protein
MATAPGTKQFRRPHAEEFLKWAINKKREEFSMKNAFKLIGIIAIAAVIGFSMAACGGDDDDSDEKIYTGLAGTVTYKLIITNTRYVLTAGGKTSTGRVENFSDGVFILIPSVEGATRFTAAVSGNSITGFTDSVTWDKESTPTPLPGTLTGGGGNPPVNPGGTMKWTKVANCPFDDGINAITFGNGKFLAGGDDGKMAYSSDGVTWTTVEDSTFTGTIEAIAYGNGLFVAVGMGSGIAYSRDGVTWTAVKEDIPYRPNIYAIAYGNGKFVAGSYYGRIMYSSDGVTWTGVENTQLDAENIKAIAYGNGKFVIAGSYNMAYSSDAINWTAVENSPFSYATFGGTLGSGIAIYAIAYGNGMFVAGGGYYGRMAYSYDGVTWTLVPNSTFGNKSGDGIHAIVYGNNKFVAGGQGSNNGNMAISTDGINWTANDVSSIFRYITAIGYNNGRYVAASWGIMAYSSE